MITHDGTRLIVSCPEGTSKCFDFENVLNQFETDLSGLYMGLIYRQQLARLNGFDEAARIIDRYLQDLAQILNDIVNTKHGQSPEGQRA